MTDNGLQHIVHFSNGTGGGVLSVIQNLLTYSTNKDIAQHVLFTINKQQLPGFIVPEIKSAATVTVFEYRPQWNFYHTCHELKKLLPHDNAILIAHDWLELGMVSNLGLPNPVVLFLHGDYDYYYELAEKNSDAIDKFVAVAGSIEMKLKEKMPGRADDIRYLRFPVPDAAKEAGLYPGKNIAFAGRLSKDKGYDLLPEIAAKLETALAGVSWHIAGSGDTVAWQKNINVQLYGALPNSTVRMLLSGMDIFILPSVAEGMPVSVVEAMKAGAIPIVNNIPGGVQELVENEKTGFLVDNNSVDDYVQRIVQLLTDEEKFHELRQNCINKSNELFDPFINTSIMEQYFLEAAQQVKNKIPKKVYGSRLDHTWLPNALVSAIRRSNE